MGLINLSVGCVNKTLFAFIWWYYQKNWWKSFIQSNIMISKMIVLALIKLWKGECVGIKNLHILMSLIYKIFRKYSQPQHLLQSLDYLTVKLVIRLLCSQSCVCSCGCNVYKRQAWLINFSLLSSSKDFWGSDQSTVPQKLPQPWKKTTIAQTITTETAKTEGCKRHFQPQDESAGVQVLLFSIRQHTEYRPV